ncbi:MAG: energy-coupling factor ABC transporter ATP-binding protein [Proteobacteria bacterium]|nr:energy-coupling factor ABC transporter ATP-binding protein [Pseudomonadota bacterium]MBU4355942.1 energy-coupling factor ABC transporter ATP-binding protein [Pseudomonadota bacterium]MBU4446989.1 energy-coupling factor ABC transporter ATP-binding protein [Pseudomonadota bacterium]
MNEPLIELHNIAFAYPGAPQPVFQDFNFQLLPGKHLGLIGPNGCGKTTLLHLIMGLLRPQAGSIVIFGQEVKKEKDFVDVRQKVGLLFQNADDQLFCPTVLEDIAFGPLNQGKPPAEAIQIARETMERLGLHGFEDRVTYKLSGGEKKLVSLATVLAMQPQLLLLDEPTAGLDEKTKDRLIHILKSLDIAFMIVSHEQDFLNHTVKECCHVHGHCCQPITT